MSELKNPNQRRTASFGPPPRPPPRPPASGKWREQLAQLAAEEPEQRRRRHGHQRDEEQSPPAFAPQAAAAVEIDAAHEREQHRREDHPAQRLDRRDGDASVDGGRGPPWSKIRFASVRRA
jgi:hypothetical protein